MSTVATAQRSVHQIVNQEGKPYQAAVTSNVWVAGPNVFSHPTEGNKVVPFTTGKDYFADLITACKGAQLEICIAGWQVNWDALLAKDYRLYDLLHEIVTANKKVNIYVMPWEHSLPVETYDMQTATALEFINEQLKTKQIRVLSSPSYAEADQRYFSHHQKQVVIDRKIAFIGGMDIAYGRYDDSTYDLNPKSEGRAAMNRYNGCVEPVGTVDAKLLVNPDFMTGPVDNFRLPIIGGKSAATNEREKLGSPGHWQVKYKEAGTVDTVDNARRTASDEVDLTTLASTQPRMPWQDVHCRIEGPAVSDLLRNFVLRWNILATGADRLVMPDDPKTYAPVGKTHVQVLRSAPTAHCKEEQQAANPRSAKPGSTIKQDNIHEAMLSLIEKSRRFIYIENQFFVSAFGQEAPRAADLSSAASFIDTFYGSSQNSTAVKMGMANSRRKIRWTSASVDRGEVLKPPTNGVCAALIQRIKRSIMDIQKPSFHLYITLPVHSEGLLSKAGVAVQVYWTMQTLVFGSQSLLNGIRRALKARELRDQKDADYERVFQDANTEYESVPIEKCFEYVTLLNLRNWAKVGERYVTEQVYVHSKLMIVDDLYALLGSANVNDRSLLGDRDSELAVLVVDGTTKRADINGAGSQREVRVFAHELRINVWEKLFGIAGGVRPASDLANAIEEPGKPDSWRLIQRRAQQNAELYEAAFPWVPKSWVNNERGEKMEASILPTWDSGAKAPKGAKWGESGRLVSPMPFQAEFWDEPRHTEAANQLDQIKGFITALPIMWTKGENNRFEYPTSLVADNDLPASTMPEEPKLIQAANQPKDVVEDVG